jgi:hypothetical protein
MQKIIFHFTCLTLLCIGLETTAQNITGIILEQKTKTPLSGATVYQDGTTNVTITDENGAFSLNTKGLDSPLIIRFMGFDTKSLVQPLQYVGKNSIIFLDEHSFFLDEVTVGKKSPFTRREMLRAFREQFLGTSIAASRCKISNEEDLFLSYDVSKKTLTATSRQPLKIRNNYLDYEVNFDLVELVVSYNSVESLAANLANNSYFSGYSFYRDFAKKDKAIKRRMETFYGSTAHFMRALAYGTLEEEKWEIYVSKFRVNPETYFEISDSAHLKKIKLIKKPERLIKLNLNEGFSAKPNAISTPLKVDSNGMVRKPEYFVPYYKRKEQSLMEFLEPTIFVDENGNYYPIYGIVFGGALGALKAGDLLPTDFFQTIKEMRNTEKSK